MFEQLWKGGVDTSETAADSQRGVERQTFAKARVTKYHDVSNSFWYYLQDKKTNKTNSMV
jgi:hypothetical protein